MTRAPDGVKLARPSDPALAGMTEIDPNIFRIKRPVLAGYRSFVERDLIVETYRSSAGQMLSCGELHRISINRTPHGRYAYRLGSNEFRSVKRPRYTLGFQPATVPLEVEGDDAEYISIFQRPDVYQDIGGNTFRPEDWEDDILSAAPDQITLHIALSLALALEQPQGADPLVMEHLGVSFACCVVRLLTNRALPTAPNALSPEPLQRVLTQIDVLLAEPDLSVGELARIAHLSPFHFSRAFKQATGMSPHRFIIERRIEQAKQRLARGTDSLAEIAYATGFSSQAHLSSMFRRITGITPKQYRRTVRG
jgi:AraC family transcriptional regulator